MDSTLIITFTAFIIVATITVSILYKNKTKGSTNLPPGSYRWPILGDSLEFVSCLKQGSPGKFVRDRMKRYESPVVKTSILGEHMVVLCGPDGNKFLFGNENKLVAIWWPASVRKLLGTCLTTTVGAQGMRMRKTVSHFVSPVVFSKLYVETIDLVSCQHFDTYWQGKEEVKVHPAVKKYAFEVACRAFMSIDDAAQIKKLGDLFHVLLDGLICIPLNLPGTGFYYAVRAAAAIKKELGIIVQQRRRALEQKTASPSQDLLSHLLVTADENGEFMSESLIVNNILLLLFAGQDTIASTITMLVKALAQHPEVYEKVLRGTFCHPLLHFTSTLSEQNEIASSKKPGEFLQWEDTQKMKYSWNVVCETLRLWPPVSSGFREALVDINYGGYIIPKGWKLFWNAPVVHADPNLFPDEKTFDPSRFEGCNNVPYSFIPFGGGPRMCLGKEFARLEILSFLHNLIRRFRWELAIPEEGIHSYPVPTPNKGLPIRIHPHKA
ncbi:cytochrome P450- family 716- subfamily A-polypeptide 1 [Striga hermonthica]|uniref:Cytochrome P450- family 716- subfamily A-polypeptide 1 n=1 Tax=Striga hermonthica TaxID=68872 RepID=A0A9N7N1J6_STRHE|nr:cytochrome P450- family 716- subfamily A-polypeptide 1 [Striga hermonthica]